MKSDVFRPIIGKLKNPGSLEMAERMKWFNEKYAPKPIKTYQYEESGIKVTVYEARKAMG